MHEKKRRKRASDAGELSAEPREKKTVDYPNRNRDVFANRHHRRRCGSRLSRYRLRSSVI